MFPVSEHGIEDGEELAHAGDQGDLFEFTRRDEARVEGPEDRVMTGSAQRGHREGAAHRGTSAPV